MSIRSIVSNSDRMDCSTRLLCPAVSLALWFYPLFNDLLKRSVVSFRILFPRMDEGRGFPVMITVHIGDT